jgi:hypothetical protein
LLNKAREGRISALETLAARPLKTIVRRGNLRLIKA